MEIVDEGCYQVMALLHDIRETYGKCELVYNYNTRAFWNYIWLKFPERPQIRVDFPDSEIYKPGFKEEIFRRVEEMRGL